MYDPFILVDNVPDLPAELRINEALAQLGQGEYEGILWSIQTNSLFATDDLEVRKICKELGVSVIGTIGLCKLGYSRGCFKDKAVYYEVIDALAEDLYLSPKLVEYAKRVEDRK